MATIADQQKKKTDLETILVSSDLDMLQVLDENVYFYAIKRNFRQVERFDRSAFEEKYQIKVSQFVDYKFFSW